MPTDLTELIKRVEKATGPDRENDALLWGLVDDRPLEECGDGPAIWKRCPNDRIAFDGPPAYTASLDAAMALVEEKLPGWTRHVDATAPDCGIDVELFAPGRSTLKMRGVYAKGTHARETHATLLALLRALQSQQSLTGGTSE